MPKLPPYVMKNPGPRGTSYEIQRLAVSTDRRPTYYRHATFYTESAANEAFDLLTAAHAAR